MKKIILIGTLIILCRTLIAQNVGIGTNTPTAKLHVNGTVRSVGLLSTDNDLVVAGQTGMGIAENPAYRLLVSGTSRFQGNGTFTGYLTVFGDLTTNAELDAQSIHSSTTLVVDERVALGGAIDPAFKLRVYDGNARVGGDAQVTGNMAIGGDLDNLYRLRVYDGNARIGGEFHATGNVGIGSNPDANYKLRVYAGNSRFDGDATITGDLNVSDVDITNTLTIGGKGSVRSNGTSPLRIGFNQKNIDIYIANNDVATVVADISDFSGDNDDVRVFVSQLSTDPASSSMSKLGISVWGVDPATDTCTLHLHNRTGSNGVFIGTIYLMTVAKN